MDEINPLKNPVEYQEKVLELMQQYEKLLNELYEEYSEKIPEHKEFWLRISQEETSHAYWLETLTNQIGSEKIYFDDKRFDIAPLLECIEEAEVKVLEARNGQISMLEATSNSYNIENGMIERKFFEIFETDSPEIKKTFNMLRSATFTHANSVREAWEKERDSLKETNGIIDRIKKMINF